jgi:type VI secretion system secreted protein VgrG
MAKYSQGDRPLRIKTPLGTDALLVEKLTGHEAISELFHFRLDLLSAQPVDFGQLLGQKVHVTMTAPGCSTRFVSGIVSRLDEGSRVNAADGKATFIRYQAEVVPPFWLLTRKIQSRIFQHLTVPDVLKQVLQGLDVVWQIHGSFEPRDYCTQYRESDFAFASRLMEEEGIHYYFKHTEDQCQMVVTNLQVVSEHPEIGKPNPVIYDDVVGGNRPEARISLWRKSQEVCTGKYLLWDHSFELPGHNLAAEQTIQHSVKVGQATHPLSLSCNKDSEIYDFPGRYARRYTGIDKGGGVQSASLQNVFNDNQRTVKLRMEEKAARSLRVTGASTCSQFTPGYKFALTRHFSGDGSYLLTRIEHHAEMPGYLTGEQEGFSYKNEFHGHPTELPYRPPLVTPRGMIDGSQTAVVVGPPGEEIFCDKYGRVKVQFNWDRQGQKNADSSCWLRVTQSWAGKGFGAVQIPRIGQEVIVDFLEGDPDWPIVVGTVYNAEQMPPHTLPDNKTYSGFKTRSQFGGGTNGNELRFEDNLGSEFLHVHAEKNMGHSIENSYYIKVGGGSGSGGGDDSSDDLGSGDGFLDQTFHVEVPQKIQIVELESSELVVGLNTEVILGGNLDMTYGLFNVGKTGVPINYESIWATVNVETITAATFAYQIGDVFESFIGAYEEVIVGDFTETITGAVLETVTGTMIEIINGNMEETVNGDMLEVVNGAMVEVIDGLMQETVTGDMTEKVGGDMTELVLGNYIEDITGESIEMKAGQRVHEHAGDAEHNHLGNVAHEVLMNYMLNVEGNILLNAPMGILLKAGSTMLLISPQGIFATAPNVSVSADLGFSVEALSASINSTSPAQLSSDAPMMIE